MASEKERIEALEDLVGHLVLNVHTCCPIPSWVGDTPGLSDAVRDWILAAKEPTSTAAQLNALVKAIRG